MTFNSIELAYLGVEVDDVEALASTLETVAGLMPGEGTATWRNDDRAHRIIATSGPANDVTVIGFELVSAAAAEAVTLRLSNLGHDVEVATAEQRQLRRVDGMWRTTAPWGTPVEIVHGLDSSPEPFASPQMPGGFKTAGLGFGHAVFMTPDLEVAHAFVTDGLGLRQTDWIEFSPVPDVAVTGRFYHGNPRHHSVALIEAPSRKRMHHFMLETNSVDDVGTAFDRALAAGLPIASGLGKHENDQMFSFYFETPAGFQIEIGHGAREVTPDWAENRAYDRISLWGHQPLPQPQR